MGLVQPPTGLQVATKPFGPSCLITWIIEDCQGPPKKTYQIFVDFKKTYHDEISFLGTGVAST